jgi:hypothetical protein
MHDFVDVPLEVDLALHNSYWTPCVEVRQVRLVPVI